MDLARVLGAAAIEAAVRETGLSLTADDVRAIAEIEQVCLRELHRVSFGGSASASLVRALGSSPYLGGADCATVVLELVEAFYELREDYPAQTTDLEVVEALQGAFDGEAAGDVALAAALAREHFATEAILSSYEIVDDDGNTYRWDPTVWHDDVEADGWFGERWDEDHE